MQIHSWKSIPVGSRKWENHLFPISVEADHFKPLCGFKGKSHPILVEHPILDRASVLDAENKTAPYCRQCVDKE